ncbi:MAG TPA: sugar-binding domain-containing protein [Propionibacteriaceae bacterium]|nr:sugar-binding domain-containing protein [Propionibacteriaceae bacterium]
MHERSDHHYLAASMYYVQGETMESIARQLSVSRSTVSRLLKDARDSGLVRITLTDPSGSQSNLANTIQRIFGVRTVIVPVREGSAEVHRLDRVARAAALLIGDGVRDNTVIGVAWGTTLAAVVPHLRPRDVTGTSVVQINGGANRVTSGIPYVGAIISQVAEAFGSDVVHFPVPAFFDFAETKQMMWRERAIRSVLEIQKSIDMAIFGVGALDGPVPSHVYSAGYLDAEDLAQLRRERVVGDVCTVLLREDGSYADISLNARASGLNPAELQRIPRRICVVAGTAKAPALVGALRARVATDLVVDEATARAVLDRL